MNTRIAQHDSTTSGWALTSRDANRITPNGTGRNFTAEILGGGQ
ncbi:hypothetical protein [Kitasatospora cineracea]|uniref:Uncharacterized protein n=1 Tax=Kitasatospora cineracea TaxID=88074 RepID=A0A3N4R5E2_9ACTN|nr:hypothetical protein [Kitasatospora cineracea]RPE26609.1 hypothetical protein EDD38_7670 [Kitasatospora cineracea]